MQLGMVGLGRMGANMSVRLLRHGHEVVGFDLGAPARDALAREGAGTAASLEELVAALRPPRILWLMVPAGPATDDTVAQLAALLSRGDVVIDGGNSNYQHAFSHQEVLAPRGVGFIDAGTSGGIWGLENGYCLMVGGDKDTVALVEPIFLALAPEGGYAHVGPVGAGHFVKMVHNGIEYGLMQAYGEGFQLMQAAPEFALDLHQIASIWRYGSVVRSWLLELAEQALRPGSDFEHIEGVVEDSGEGRWTVEEALSRAVPLSVITESVYRRFSSRDKDSYSDRLIAALRNQFGGHAVQLDSEGR